MTLQPFDFYTQHKVLQKLSDNSLRLVALNLTGGFQTGATKAIWDATASASCPFCGEIDTHEHRLLQCKEFQHVRDGHPSAVQILSDFPNLLWLPLATSHAQQIVYNRLKLSRQGPFLDQPFLSPQGHCIFYTDGTCDKPREQNCCRAAWAVVQHVQHSPSDPSPEDFVVTQTSHTKGFQSINRAELEAVTWLAHYFHQHLPYSFMSVFSGSSFVIQVVEAIASGKLSGKTHHLAHADLVQTLLQCWNPLFHNIYKVKSHRRKEDAKDSNDLYTILGNDLADEVAKAINKRDLPILLNASRVISEHSVRQIDSLLSVYLYLAELNSLHSQLKLQKEHPAATQSAHASVDDYANFHAILSTWSIDDAQWCFDSDLPEVVAQACPAGAHIAFNVWCLFRKFKWRDPSLPKKTSDFGITWFELAICYAVNFGSFLPLWICNGKRKRAVPFAFDSSEAKVQKPEARSIWHQANNLRAVVRYLENTLQCQLFHDIRKRVHHP